MAIDCDHERPELGLPPTTPPQLGWQVPSFFAANPEEFRRQLLETLSGIYLEQARRFAQPTIVPLFGEALQLVPGQVAKGVASGQVLQLLPPVQGGSVEPVTVIVTAVESPITVARTAEDGTVTEDVLNLVGAYTFFPDDDGGFQQSPGDALAGSGGPTYTLRTADTLAPNAYVATASAEIVPTYDDGPPRLLTWLIAAASIALSKLADITGPAFLGRLTGTGAPETLTGTQATTMLDAFTDSLKGLVPASGGGTVNFLRADGSFAAPPDTDTTYTAGDGLNLVGTEFAVDVADFAGTGLTVSSNNLNVDFSSVTYSAGDGLDLGANVFSVDVSDFAGATLEDDGANNLRISSAAAGNGLTGGGSSALEVGQGDGITVNANDVEVFVADFAGSGLETDGANNLRISSSAAGGGLGGGSGSALFVESSLDSNARVGVRESTGTTFLRRRISFIEGSNVSINVSDDSGSEEVDVTISATDNDTTYSAGDGIDLGGTTFSADVSDFAGTGIEDDGANNLRIASSAAGNGLTGGGGSALAVGSGDGITVNANSIEVDASDLATASIIEVSNNLERAALTGEVTASQGSNSLSITRSTTFSWTGTHTFTASTTMDSRFRLDTVQNAAAGNNVSLNTDTNVLRLTSGTTLTGIDAISSSQIIAIVNATSATISAIKESGSSSAANRFGGSSSTILIPEGDMLIGWYDGTSSRWRLSRGLV